MLYLYKEILEKCTEKISNSIAVSYNTDNTEALFALLKNATEILNSINLNITNNENFKNNFKEIQNLIETPNSLELLSIPIDEFNTNYNNFENSSIEITNQISLFLKEYIKFYNAEQVKKENPKIKAKHKKEKKRNKHSKEKSLTKSIESPQIEVLKPQTLIEVEVEPKVQPISVENTKISENITNNNKLIISEKKNSVFLPYSLIEVQDIFEKNKDQYIDLQDVIDANYVIPLSRFKNPILSRFKETFHLMKEKENASLPQCLDMALELSFNTLLNPAIIPACKSLDELDIYLDCLYNNKLDKFPLFEIEYDVTPLKI